MKNHIVGLSRIILETFLFGYMMPSRGELYRQKLTICADGNVDFVVEYYGLEDTTQTCTITSKQAMQILDLIQSRFEHYHRLVQADDVPSCNLIMEYEDGKYKQLEGLLLDYPIMSDLTEIIVNALPFDNVKAFGTNGVNQSPTTLRDIKKGIVVYNTTFGYGIIKAIVSERVKISFESGDKYFKFPEAFMDNTVVLGREASKCSEPVQPITSIQLVKHHSGKQEQITVWSKKKKGRINVFWGDVFTGSRSFPADDALRERLFQTVTQLDREDGWVPEDWAQDEEYIQLSYSFATGHRKSVIGSIEQIPGMHDIDALFHMLTLSYINSAPRTSTGMLATVDDFRSDGEMLDSRRITPLLRQIIKDHPQLRPNMERMLDLYPDGDPDRYPVYPITRLPDEGWGFEDDE